MAETSARRRSRRATPDAAVDTATIARARSKVSTRPQPPRPRSRARITAAVRSPTSSLAKIVVRLLLTVFGERCRVEAISAVRRPWASSSRISFSRAVSSGNGSSVAAWPGRVREVLQHPRGDRRAEDRLAADDGPDRVGDLVLLGALEQVAAGAGLHRGEHGGVLVVHRQHQHRGLGHRLADPPGRLDPVEAGHPDVHQHDVRLGQLGLADRGLAVLGLADHLEVVEGAEQRGQAPAYDGVVVGEQHADRLGGDHLPIIAVAAPRALGKKFPHRGAGREAPGRRCSGEGTSARAERGAIHHDSLGGNHVQHHHRPVPGPRHRQAEGRPDPLHPLRPGQHPVRPRRRRPTARRVRRWRSSSSAASSAWSRLVAAILAWRGNRPALRVGAGAMIVMTLTGLPAFFVDVPMAIKALVGVQRGADRRGRRPHVLRRPAPRARHGLRGHR